MEMSQFHHLPLTPGFFPILVGIFLTGILAVLLVSLYARPRQA